MSSKGKAGSAAASGRDLRIDLFRGLALWMIFVDHIDGNWLGTFTYHGLGFSDAREIFIFLSGISCSLLYGRLEEQSGLAWAQFRALHRAIQIYLGYALVVFFTFAALLSLRGLAEPHFASTGEFALLFADPPRALATAAGLYYTPGYLDILPLYIWLVAAAPLMVFMLRRAPRATLLASAALWLAAQADLLPQIPSLDPGGKAALNPLSWQFLFCIGLATGQHFHRAGRSFRANRPTQLLCGAIVAANLACSVLDHAARSSLGQRLPLAATLHALRVMARAGSGEHALRLLHFLAVAYLVASVLRASHPLLRSAWLRPLILTGQFPLQSFCLGAVMSVLGTLYWLADAPRPLAQALATLLGCALMAALALALAATRRSPRRSESPGKAELVPAVDEAGAV